jgi:hypothetical protein
MAAAYILNDAQALGDIMISMMLHHQGYHLSLADQVTGLTDWIPWKVLCKYQVCRRL